MPVRQAYPLQRRPSGSRSIARRPNRGIWSDPQLFYNPINYLRLLSKVYYDLIGQVAFDPCRMRISQQGHRSMCLSGGRHSWAAGSWSRPHEGPDPLRVTEDRNVRVVGFDQGLTFMEDPVPPSVAPCRWQACERIPSRWQSMTNVVRGSLIRAASNSTRSSPVRPLTMVRALLPSDYHACEAKSERRAAR